MTGSGGYPPDNTKEHTMSYDFTGTVKAIKPVQTFPSGFAKREAVIFSDGDRFPQNVVFEFVRERMSLLDNVNEGDRVTVSFDLRSNESKQQPGRYFLSLNAWKLVKADDAAAAASAPVSDGAPEPTPVAPVDTDVGDMPF